MLIPSEKRLLGLGQNKVRQSTLCKSGICGILVHGMATFACPCNSSVVRQNRHPDMECSPSDRKVFAANAN